MKTVISILIGILLSAASVSADVPTVLTVFLMTTNGTLQRTINGKTVTREQVKAILGKLAGISKDEQLFVSVDETVTATDLIRTISDIQSNGLHNVVLMTPAVEGGKRGMYQVPIDSASRKFSGCIAGVDFEGGYLVDTDGRLLDLGKPQVSADGPQTHAPQPQPRQPDSEKRPPPGK